jgi:hypothetical protein
VRNVALQFAPVTYMENRKRIFFKPQSLCFKPQYTAQKCAIKAELLQVGILFGTQFPSLGIFISKKSWIS